MAQVPITLMGYRCERCEHEWLPRDKEHEPRVCPRCKSPYWNRPRKAVAEEAQAPGDRMLGDLTLERRFRTLADTWRRETAGGSVVQKKIMHSAYQQIIGLGPGAVPLLLQELQRSPGYWFWALSSITGENPVNSGAGFDRAVEDWLSWGHRRGLID